MKQKKKHRFNIQDNEIAQNLLESMIMNAQETLPIKNQSLQLMMALLLSELSNNIEKEASSFSDDETNILPVLNYLGNKLKEETGSTFKELIDKRRLDIASELLLNTNYTTEEITTIIGFQSTPSLFRLFKKHTDSTPLEYKALHRNS